MKGSILLDYQDDTKKVESEEKDRFLRSLLEQMGVPIADFWIADGPLSVFQKIQLRNILALYSIQVIDDLDGHLQIYVDNEIVGEWFKPTYKLKRDLKQRDPKKQLYIEMEINCWTLFEEELTQEN